jgi:amino acid permease
MSNEVKSFFIIVSTIIGLGVFALPYTFSKSGYFFFLWLIFWFFAFFILHLIWGEILFQSKENHNLPGLTAIYLHPKLKNLVWFSDFFGLLGVFLVYFIALVKFWQLIFPNINPLILKLIFAVFNIYFIAKDMLLFSKLETILGLTIIFIFIFISFSLLPNFNFDNIAQVLTNNEKPLLPYGLILFALSGTSALPIVYDLLGKNKKSYFKVNFYSLFFIVLLYLTYAFSLVGALGNQVSEESLQSLVPYLPKLFLIAAVILVTINITFVDMAFYLKRGLIFDYHFSNRWANWLLALIIFSLAFWQSTEIIPLVDFISSVFLGFNLLITCLIYLKLKKRFYFQLPSILVVILTLIFASGVIYGILPK